MHINSFIQLRSLSERVLNERDGDPVQYELSLVEEETLVQALFSRLHGSPTPVPSQSSDISPFNNVSTPGVSGVAVTPGSTGFTRASSANAAPGWFGGDGIPDELEEEWERFWHRMIYEFWAYKPFENNPRATLAGNWTYIGGYRVGFDGYIFGDPRFYYEIGIRNVTMWDIAIFVVSLAVGVGYYGLIVGGEVLGFAITKAAEWFADWLVDDEKANAMIGGISAALGTTGGFFSSQAQTLGGEMAAGWQNVGGVASQGWKNAGGAISQGWKDAGGAISHGWKNAGGAISGGWKRAGGAVSGGLKNATIGISL